MSGGGRPPHDSTRKGKNMTQDLENATRLERENDVALVDRDFLGHAVHEAVRRR